MAVHDAREEVAKTNEQIQEPVYLTTPLDARTAAPRDAANLPKDETGIYTIEYILQSIYYGMYIMKYILQNIYIYV